MLRPKPLTLALVCLGCTGGAALSGTGPDPDTLLTALLRQASQLTVSMTNIAENLHRVDGSVVIESMTVTGDLVAAITALTDHGPAGQVSRVSSSLSGSDLSGHVLAVLHPTVLDVGSIATTAIGSLQSGALLGSTGTTGTVNTTGLAQRVTLQITGAATDRVVLAQSSGSIAATMALQNVASNLGDLDGSIQIRLADTLTHTGTLATTAIGSMESGMLTASLTGNMTDTSTQLETLVTALVGQ